MFQTEHSSSGSSQNCNLTYSAGVQGNNVPARPYRHTTPPRMSREQQLAALAQHMKQKIAQHKMLFSSERQDLCMDTHTLPQPQTYMMKKYKYKSLNHGQSYCLVET